MKAWNLTSSAILLKDHWVIVLLSCIAIFPLFADLGGDYLWADEGDTAVLARSIVKHGVPKAWDGVTFTDADFGDRLNRNLVMVSHPWLQYYVTAASFFVLGESAFSARFPFALAGLLSISLLYVLVFRITSDKRAALSAAILMMLSVQFLLFSRQCRNYSLNLFLGLVLILLFFSLTNRRGAILFAAVATLLFHCNPSGVALIGGLGLLTLIHRPFFQFRRWFWLAMPIVALFVVPWIFMAKAGYQQNTSMIDSWGKLGPRLTQFFVECASITPLVGVIVLFMVVWIRKIRLLRIQGLLKLDFKSGRKISLQLFEPGERNLLILVGVIFLSYAALIAVTQSRYEMWNFGLRHVTPLIALALAAVAMLVSKVSRSNTKLWLAIMLLLGFTKLGRITPWSFLQEERTFLDQSVFAAMHVPKGWAPKIFRVGLIAYSRELWHENRGTVAHVCEYLGTNAAPDDAIITNYDWEPIYFHTRLPQALKVMPHYRIYDIARGHNLPNYVFSVENTKWVVWRTAWEGYRDFTWKDVYTALIASGATVTPVASVPETAWENRSNIHFHRFPGDTYYYPFYNKLPDAMIYRVDWPDQAAGAANVAEGS